MDRVLTEMHSNPAAFAERIRHDASVVTLVDANGATLLHHAYVYPQVVAALLEAGADPNARNAKGDTPVHVAAKWSALEALRLLLAAGGVSTTADSEGYTPLDWAAARDRDDVARLLRGETEPEFVYIRPAVEKKRIDLPRLGVGLSIAITIILLLVSYVGYAAAKAGLQYRSEDALLASDGVATRGVVVDHIDGKVGVNNPKTAYYPVVAYRVYAREYRRFTNRAYLAGAVPPRGATFEVRYLPRTPEVARVTGVDHRGWLGLTAFGGALMLVAVTLFSAGVWSAVLFARTKKPAMG